MEKVAIDFKHSEKKSIALELNCGTADAIKELAQSFPSNTFIAVDDNKKVIERLCREREQNNITFICDALQTYNLKKQGFNKANIVVWCKGVHHTKESDINNILTNIANNLADNGTIVIQCKKVQEDDLLEKTVSDVLGNPLFLPIKIYNAVSSWISINPQIDHKKLKDYLFDNGLTVIESKEKVTTIKFQSETSMLQPMVHELKERGYGTNEHEGSLIDIARGVIETLRKKGSPLTYSTNTVEIRAQKNPKFKTEVTLSEKLNDLLNHNVCKEKTNIVTLGGTRSSYLNKELVKKYPSHTCINGKSLSADLIIVRDGLRLDESELAQFTGINKNISVLFADMYKNLVNNGILIICSISASDQYLQDAITIIFSWQKRLERNREHTKIKALRLEALQQYALESGMKVLNGHEEMRLLQFASADDMRSWLIDELTEQQYDLPDKLADGIIFSFYTEQKRPFECLVTIVEITAQKKGVTHETI